MKIKISNLSPGIHELSYDGEVKEIGLGEPFGGFYLLNIKIDKASHQVVLYADIELTAHFCCDRCAAEFDSKIKTGYEMVYIFESPPDYYDDTTVQYIPLETDKIDISKEIYDYTYLSIPMRILCKEDCKGLCLKCGTDLNENSCSCENEEVDPRWLPLMKLKKDSDN